MFHTTISLKEGHVLLSLHFNFALEHNIRKVKANHRLLKFNGTQQVIIYGGDVNLQGQSVQTVSCFIHCRGTGLEGNVDRAENIFLFHQQQTATQNIFLFDQQHTATQNHNTQTHTINPLKAWQISDIWE
jgi:hypothetical protein